MDNSKILTIVIACLVASALLCYLSFLVFSSLGAVCGF